MSIDIGASRLRLLAKWHAGQPALVAELRQLADAWEADRAEIAHLQELAYLGEHHFPDQTYKARLDELALDHAVALSKQADSLLRAERAEAALERARALLAELEWCGVDNWLECPWCLGTKAEHYGEPAGHKPDCKLAALLAPASGGAA